MQRTSRNVQVFVLASGAMLAGGWLVAAPAGAAPTSFAPTSSPTPSITTIAGNGTAGYSGDGGPAVKAAINYPTGVTEDVGGNVYIGDTANNRIRKVVKPTTINQDLITTFAGTGVRGFTGDGGQAKSAELNSPTGTAIDSSGNFYVADTGNNRVRKISPSGVITTIAGNGTSCGSNEMQAAQSSSPKTTKSIGNGGPATQASLCYPTGLAFRNGNLYIADSGHDEVRVVTSGGIINVFAGNGTWGLSGDGGPSTASQLALPTGIGFDAVSHLYIADTGNSKVRVVDSGMRITTFAGTGKSGYSGDGGAATKAQLSYPTGVGVDPSGNVYISDTLNNRIRKVGSGIITTYGGNGTAGFSGDGGPATSAKINSPTGSVAADGTAVYFADTGNQRIRGIFSGPPPVLPETPFAILLPVGAILAGAAGVLAMRRRSRRHAIAGAASV